MNTHLIHIKSRREKRALKNLKQQGYGYHFSILQTETFSPNTLAAVAGSPDYTKHVWPMSGYESPSVFKQVLRAVSSYAAYANRTIWSLPA